MLHQLVVSVLSSKIQQRSLSFLFLLVVDLYSHHLQVFKTMVWLVEVGGHWFFQLPHCYVESVKSVSVSPTYCVLDLLQLMFVLHVK